MIHTNRIDWQAIAMVPPERKDGRSLLLWQGEPFIGRWVTDAEHSAWAAADERIIAPTHWADINAPEI